MPTASGTTFHWRVDQRTSAARRTTVAETPGTDVMCITRTAAPPEVTAGSPDITTWRQRTGTVPHRATRTLRWLLRRTSTSARHRTTTRAHPVTTNKNQLLQKVTSTYGRRSRPRRPDCPETAAGRPRLAVVPAPAPRLRFFPPSSHYRPLHLEEELRLVFRCQNLVITRGGRK